jgi:outer membrane protein TolC
MFRSCKHAHILRAGGRASLVALGAWLLVSGAVAAQDLAPATTKPELSLATATGLPLRVTFPLIPGSNAKNAVPSASGFGGLASTSGLFSTSSTPKPGDAPAGLRLITLEEAQKMAAGASNPLVRLGELQVEAAKQHRLGVQGLYFPNIGSQVENLHFNKNTGPVLTFDRLGATIPIDIIGKNQTAFNVAAVQPITPLFSIYQLVKISRADENIARAKAGMPVAETASNVEKNYFDLLVAQRELTSAQADAKKIQAKWLTASNSGAPIVSAEQETDMLGAEKAVVLSTSKVKELTESLNDMLGLPEGTALELVPPAPLVEDVSIEEATAKATAGNPEVVEAEQTAVKAHAGLTLTKLQYLPSVAIVGGYTNQTALKVVLPNDFSYIGLVGTFTVFDGLKREHTVKEVKAQSEMADLAVQLTKAKVAGGVKSSYLELDRSRQLAQLARRMVTATQVVEASYHSDSPDNPEVESARAKMEADMFKAELEYREAYAKLKSLMGSKLAKAD